MTQPSHTESSDARSSKTDGDGRVVVVAGAGGPTGQAVVRALAAGGARVVAAFDGFTHVDDLGLAIAGLWDRPSRELNGVRVDLSV
jgi:NAD(P)-dependent dehydrogenase (short-subunit alcohol dehydrogenase family)